MRMTEQRRIIAQIIEQASRPPRCRGTATAGRLGVDPRISLSTVYRTLNLFEEAGLVTKHDFKDGRARFELIPDEHHDHLIDIRSGKVIEFRNEEIEAIQDVIARRLGYRLVDHRLELYAVPLEKKDKDDLMAMIVSLLFFVFVLVPYHDYRPSRSSSSLRRSTLPVLERPAARLSQARLRCFSDCG